MASDEEFSDLGRQALIHKLNSLIVFLKEGTNRPGTEEDGQEEAVSRTYNQECVLTHVGQRVEVAHIYPYFMGTIPKED
ncbi:hypothetical protein DTO164E3_6744 [Paecilomyces variotii]|nr:hypothetical protein DTO032I3_8479 [Paecilomyces variotii]KAJ9195431.1 hypothetical protein DTO164E3_6744 [Paecilomyces variotii]KAJ9242526.1 hypothetical protein DTO169E5_3089 [Paecilomyces variotii]KAJ9361695.1 hypothetical protein DTO280E4_3733 [Paecilomyces variotii]KAJ9381024.1 hypothetical protein DTO032I4_6308 [Paecilomyces variotii]